MITLIVINLMASAFVILLTVIVLALAMIVLYTFTLVEIAHYLSLMTIFSFVESVWLFSISCRVHLHWLFFAPIETIRTIFIKSVSTISSLFDRDGSHRTRSFSLRCSQRWTPMITLTIFSLNGRNRSLVGLCDVATVRSARPSSNQFSPFWLNTAVVHSAPELPADCHNVVSALLLLTLVNFHLHIYRNHLSCSAQSYRNHSVYCTQISKVLWRIAWRFCSLSSCHWLFSLSSPIDHSHYVSVFIAFRFCTRLSWLLSWALYVYVRSQVAHTSQYFRSRCWC